MGQLGAANRRYLDLERDKRHEDAGAHPTTHSSDDCDAASQGLLAGLGTIGRAAALLDRDDEIIATNALARPFVDMLACAGLGRPASRSRSIHQRVRDIIDAARRRDPAGDAAVFALPDGEMLIVRATALGTEQPGLFPRASMLVQFTKLGFDSAPNPAFLRSAFGLTITESEVALALVGGASASAIARDRAVGLETIRSHLKTIFAKTGTRRQAHLVALILQLREVAPAN